MKPVKKCRPLEAHAGTDVDEIDGWETMVTIPATASYASLLAHRRPKSHPSIAPLSGTDTDRIDMDEVLKSHPLAEVFAASLRTGSRGATDSDELDLDIEETEPEWIGDAVNEVASLKRETGVQPEVTIRATRGWPSPARTYEVTLRSATCVIRAKDEDVHRALDRAFEAFRAQEQQQLKRRVQASAPTRLPATRAHARSSDSTSVQSDAPDSRSPDSRSPDSRPSDSRSPDSGSADASPLDASEVREKENPRVHVQKPPRVEQPDMAPTRTPDFTLDAPPAAHHRPLLALVDDSLPHLEASVAAQSNDYFWEDLDCHRGVFLATYKEIPVGTTVRITVHLPGADFTTLATVAWVRPCLEHCWPGLGLKLQTNDRINNIIARFSRFRPSLFHTV